MFYVAGLFQVEKGNLPLSFMHTGLINHSETKFRSKNHQLRLAMTI